MKCGMSKKIQILKFEPVEISVEVTEDDLGLPTGIPAEEKITILLDFCRNTLRDQFQKMYNLSVPEDQL